MKGLKKTIAERKLEKADQVKGKKNSGGDAAEATASNNPTGTPGTRKSSSKTVLSTSRGPRSDLETVVGPTTRSSGMQVHLSG